MNQVATIKNTENQNTGLSMRMTVQDLIEQRRVIKTVMQEVMVDGVDYGKIPGCGDKPTMLKPGAEKLCSVFGFSPEFEVQVNDMGSGHREYEITCKLYHRSGTFLGAGIGTCSTMESKYRYINSVVSTGKPVPRDYWKDRNPALLGGPGFMAKKDDSGAWMIHEKKGKEDRSDPADQYNTVKKVAKKRALIDSVLTATATSDLFTQDIEEMVEEEESPSNNVNRRQQQVDNNEPTQEELWNAFYKKADPLLPEINKHIIESELPAIQDTNQLHFIFNLIFNGEIKPSYVNKFDAGRIKKAIFEHVIKTNQAGPNNG